MLHRHTDVTKHNISANTTGATDSCNNTPSFTLTYFCVKMRLAHKTFDTNDPPGRNCVIHFQ